MLSRMTALIFVLLLASSPTLRAQDAESQQNLAQTAANPIANLISLPIQINNDFGIGPYDRSVNVLNVQPVVPLAGGKLVTRTIFPFVWLPDVTSESESLSSGLSDILFTAFYVPSEGPTMWGVGPVLELPSGGSERGSEKWSAGVSGVVLAQPGDWTLGLLACASQSTPYFPAAASAYALKLSSCDLMAFFVPSSSAIRLIPPTLPSKRRRCVSST